jgi:hypothetical protein
LDAPDATKLFKAVPKSFLKGGAKRESAEAERGVAAVSPIVAVALIRCISKEWGEMMTGSCRGFAIGFPAQNSTMMVCTIGKCLSTSLLRVLA